MILKSKTLRICLLSLFVVLFAANISYAYAPDKGMFLVADKDIADPRFRDGVILLIQHNAQGSAGLVINRGSRLPLSSILPADSALVESGVTLSYGGPVEPQGLLALVQVRHHSPEPADEVIDNLFVTGVAVLDGWSDFSDEVIGCRVFVGYTGWSSGQLAKEVQRGDWLVIPADAESVLSGTEGQLWESLQENFKGRD